ncbi:hypothetical protein ScPMuIL_001278 [Solemya velum]
MKYEKTSRHGSNKNQSSIPARVPALDPVLIKVVSVTGSRNSDQMNEYSPPAASSLDDRTISQPAENDGTRKFKIGKCEISINSGYLTSVTGVLNAVEIVLSLIGLIVVSASATSACVTVYGDSYSFYEFTTSTWFILSFLRYALFGLSLEAVLCFKMIPWTLVILGTELVFSMFMLISGSVVASNDCFKGGYRAAAAFAFMCLGAMVVDFVFLFVKLRKEHPPTNNRFLIMIGIQPASNVQAPEYHADANMEDSKY